MKLLVSGNNTFKDKEAFTNAIDRFIVKHIHDTVELIITGADEGTERFARDFATDNGIPLQIFMVDTDTYGSEAEVIRDTQMVDSATALLVFYDGVSTGHPRKQDQAKKKGIVTEVIDYSKL